MSPPNLLPDRIIEQLEAWTIWDRRAWEPGTVLCLRELSEALTWVPEGVLSAAAVDWYRQSLQRRIGQDLGLPSGGVTAQLNELLRRPLSADTQSHRRFDQLVEFIDANYMDSWRRALQDHPERLHLERASRLLTTHVVDAGYSPDWLRKEVGSWIGDGADLVAIVSNLGRLTGLAPRAYDGFVLITQAPEMKLLERAETWVPAHAMKTELQRLGAAGGIAFQGGLRIRVQALDPLSAAQEVSNLLERLSTRARFVRSGKPFEFVPTFFTDNGEINLGFKRGGVHVQSPVGAETLYTSVLSSKNRTDNPTNSALELASPLLGSNDTAAIASSWAALESLLVSGSDASERSSGRAIAADRASAVITAGWPRSEFTRLAWRVYNEKRKGTRIYKEILAAKANNENLGAVMARWISSGQSIEFAEPRDQAALLRMRELVNAPKPVLRRVRNYTTSSLRRLYRQRNIILHGGEVQSIALRPCLRTSAPLVTAALDRLLHAYDLANQSPLNVAARAEVALDAAGDPRAWPLHNLTSM